MSQQITKVTILPTVIIVGLSGAGKSTALQVFEDLKFITADGLPISMLPEVVRLFRSQQPEGCNGLALGVGQLSETVAESLLRGLHLIAQTEKERPLLLFLTASSSVILRRYATTRRPHPLERQGLGLEQAMHEEVDRLFPLREAADIVIDTSNLSIHDLRRKIQTKWTVATSSLKSLKVNLLSFGFKYGAPREADLVFDLRFLPNPYFVDCLKPLSGKDKAVFDYVFAESASREFKARLIEFLQYLLPLYDAEGRYRLTIAIGCTGGRHRSVAMVEALSKALLKNDYAVSVEHRHMELG